VLSTAVLTSPACLKLESGDERVKFLPLRNLVSLLNVWWMWVRHCYVVGVNA